MAKTNPERSGLMRVLRLSPVPIVLLGAAGGVMMAVGHAGTGERPFLRDAGYHLLVLAGFLFVVVLWGGVYLDVVEASRGLPGRRPVDGPDLTFGPDGLTAKLRELDAELAALGFRPDGWFALDTFAQTHVGAWRHESRPAAAFVLCDPGAGFRLRFVRRFASGGVLVSSTRLCDLAYPPPQGIYLQVKPGASAGDLWAWHRAAEALFPDAPDAAPVEVAPQELFVAVSARWAGHRRRDRTWLLAVEPVGECWRLYHLRGMPLARQFELGWSIPFWQ